MTGMQFVVCALFGTADKTGTWRRHSLTRPFFVRIEGIDQWVTIKGVRCDYLVILMVHGGPGNPNTVDSVLTVDQLARDGIAVAKRRPALFHAYVGTAQLVSQRANMTAFYTKTLERVRDAGNEKTAATLTALGAPPWLNPRAFGVVRRAAGTGRCRTR